MNVGMVTGGLISIICGIILITQKKKLAYGNARNSFLFKPNYSERYTKRLEITYMISGILFMLLGVVFLFKG